MSKLNQFFRKRENLQKTKIFIGFLIVLALFGDKLQLGTQSFLFSFLGGSIAFAVILFAVGLFLIFIPEPSTTIIGIVAAVIAIVITGGAIFTAIISFFRSIPSPGGFPLWAILILGIIGIYFYTRRRRI